jgi:hypothetical protein
MKLATGFLLTASCLLLALPALAQLHHYYPLEPGNYRLYVNELDPSVHVVMYVEPAAEPELSVFTREVRESGVIVDVLRLKARSNAEGDVFFDFVDFGAWLPFIPSYFLIDAPLFTGKTWGTVTSIPVFANIVLNAEVVAEEMVTTPVGMFYSYHVHYVEEWDILGTIEEDYWFVDGLGQSKFFLAGYDGAFLFAGGDIIPTESTSWGSVKATFGE